MKLKRIASEMRTIELSYEEERPLSEYETQVIDRYVEIHSRHAAFELGRAEHSVTIEALTKRTEATQAWLDRTKSLLNALLAATGVNYPPGKGSEALLQKLQAQASHYNDSVSGLHDELVELNTCWTEACDRFGVFYEDWDTHFETQLEEFSDFTDKLYENYEEYQLDIDTFWSDHELFRGFLWETHQKIDALHTRLGATLDDWDKLVLAANLFFDFVQIQDKFRDIGSPDMLN
jgi:hypothetical protein